MYVQILQLDEAVAKLHFVFFSTVSWVSGNTLLGVPAEAYMYGAQYDLIGVGKYHMYGGGRGMHTPSWPNFFQFHAVFGTNLAK